MAEDTSAGKRHGYLRSDPSYHALNAMDAADTSNHVLSLMNMLNDKSHTVPPSYRSTVASRLPKTS